MRSGNDDEDEDDDDDEHFKCTPSQQATTCLKPLPVLLLLFAESISVSLLPRWGAFPNQFRVGALSTCVLLLVAEDVPDCSAFRRRRDLGLIAKLVQDVSEVLFVPWAAAVLCLLLSAISQLQRCRSILCREELILRILELVVLTLVLTSVLAAIVELSQSLALGIGGGRVGMAGIVAGTGICALALLHARMAVAESRPGVFGAISDRLLIAEMRCGESASLPSSVASVHLEVSGDLSLSAARSGSGWQSGRMVRVVCPPDPEVGDATSNGAAASAEPPAT
eukprot:s8255_g1.t1